VSPRDSGCLNDVRKRSSDLPRPHSTHAECSVFQMGPKSTASQSGLSVSFRSYSLAAGSQSEIGAWGHGRSALGHSSIYGHTGNFDVRYCVQTKSEQYLCPCSSLDKFFENIKFGIQPQPAYLGVLT